MVGLLAADANYNAVALELDQIREMKLELWNKKDLINELAQLIEKAQQKLEFLHSHLTTSEYEQRKREIENEIATYEYKKQELHSDFQVMEEKQIYLMNKISSLTDKSKKYFSQKLLIQELETLSQETEFQPGSVLVILGIALLVIVAIPLTIGAVNLCIYISNKCFPRVAVITDGNGIRIRIPNPRKYICNIA